MKHVDARKIPVMLLPNISKKSEDLSILLTRLNRYSREFSKFNSSKHSKLVIIGSVNSSVARQICLTEFESLEIFLIDESSGILKFCIQANLILKKNGWKPSLLIAGDPWLGFISSLALKIIHAWSPRIQIQVHGDLYKFSFSNNFFQVLKTIAFNIEILIAGSIRCVSEHQKIEIGRRFPFKKKIIVIAPIPINEIYFDSDLDQNREFIGFVGRLHSERGINQLSKIITKISEIFPNAKINIIGDGPAKLALESMVKGIEGAEFNFYGWIQPSELCRHYERMKVLISTAPSEGYGLAIREALMCGVSIVAQNSLGLQQAKFSFPNEIGLFDSTEEALLEIKNSIEDSISRDRVLEIRRLQKQADYLNIENLVKSWID